MVTKLIPRKLPICLGDPIQEIMDSSGLTLGAFEITLDGIVVHFCEPYTKDLRWYVTDTDTASKINVEAVSLGLTVRMYRITVNGRWDGSMTDDYDEALAEGKRRLYADKEGT